LLSRAHEAGAPLDGVEAPRIGVIGSRSKWQAFEAVCLEQGLPESLLDQVVCPIGLNIGAQTPQEIAVAVVAQIMAAHKGARPEDPNWRQA
jgi:xanthine dehydrogenase accessory factor